MADGWRELAALASTIDRLDLTVDAYTHLIGLKPDDPAAYLGMSDALLQLRKFDDAREYAALGARIATDQDVPSRTAAHELLAQIALAQHNADEARQEAEIVRQLDAGVPMPSYVKGRLLYDEGHYDDALPPFEEAMAALKQSGGAEIPGLHFYAADTLMKLDRYPEAETELSEELRHFPTNSRARGALAALYQTTGRDEEAARTVSDLTRINPTPDSYALAARLWKSFGNPRQAGVVRAEAQRAFAGRSSATLAPRR
jgi:tetratricopeptide (TPR) repeat protein